MSPAIAFKIGLNPMQTADRPYKYATLRHAPAASTQFDYYGANLLPTFDAVPTWKLAAPQNIQKVTPQNKTCDNCHGQAELFFQAGDVAPAEQEANKGVIVPAVPRKVGL